MDRFFVPTLAVGDVTLPDTEARHIRQVLRKKAGDRIRLFDGRGVSADAELTDVSKRAVTAQVAEVDEAPPVSGRLVIAAACPKADRLKWMVEKLTELGADVFLPLRTVRSVVDPGATKLEKLTATVIAACKQSGRNRLLVIDPAADFADALRMTATRKHIADTGLHRQTQIAADPPDTVADAVESVCLIGPEGGWTDEERAAAAAAGFLPLHLGPHTLRTETAAVAATVRLIR